MSAFAAMPPASRGWRLVLAALLTSAFSGTCAMARWAEVAQGSGVAAAGTLESVTIDDVVIDRALYPGGRSNVRLHVTNANAFPVDLVSIEAAPVTSDAPGCGDAGNPTGVSLDLGSISGSIPATSTKTYVVSASMDLSSAPACQGATFTAAMSVRVRR